jgi:hypothetical protein
MKSFLTFAEALKGKQHKIDVDKDGKIEGEDLAKLRAKKIKEELVSEKAKEKDDEDEDEDEDEMEDDEEEKEMKEEEAKQIGEVKKATGGLKDACWKGYTAVGMKMKNGRKVPNCVPEETDLEEKMNLAKASMGDVIKDFKKSDAPQFAGKSVEKRREMAIAAKLSADRGVREEVEQIDELSKSTLGSYVKKASTNARINSMISKDFDHKAMTARKPSTRDAYYGLSSKHKQKSWKRSDNVAKAVDRLTKEEVEELDEISLQTMRSARDKLKSRAFDAHMDDNKYAAQHYAGRAVNMARKIRQKEHQVTKEEVDPTHKKILNKAKTSVPKAPKSEYERKVVSYLKKKYSEEVELEEVETTNESSAYGRISSRFKTFSGRSLDAAAKEHGDEAKKLQKEIEAQQKEIDRRKAAMKEEVKPMKPPFNAPYKKAAGDVKDKSGAVHTAASRAKHLAKTGMKTQTPVKEGVFGALAGGVLGGLAGGPLGAAAGAYLGHKAQQAGTNAKEVNKKLKKEEVEQIDELSFNTLASYASKVDQKDKQPLSKKRQAGYNSAAERMSQKAQTADLKKWGKISDSVEYNFDNEGNLMSNPVSFKQFLDQLDEIKMADLPSRKVSGRGYGTEYYKKEAEKDKSGYDDEKKEKSEVKRGRGRPVGSASGARQKGSTTGKKRSGVEMTGYPLHLPNKN